VYEKYFEKIWPEAKIIYPDEGMQREVTRGICNTKNTSRFLPDDHPDRPRNIFGRICEYLFERSADLVIVGCTDIRVDFKTENKKVVDSLEVLAKCIVENCMDNKDSIAFWRQMADNSGFKPGDTKLANNQDTSDYDSAFIMKYANSDSDILDLGSGGGLIINKYYRKIKSITAVELFEKFTRFIAKSPNIKICNVNLFDYEPHEVCGGL